MNGKGTIIPAKARGVRSALQRGFIPRSNRARKCTLSCMFVLHTVHNTLQPCEKGIPQDMKPPSIGEAGPVPLVLHASRAQPGLRSALVLQRAAR